MTPSTPLRQVVRATRLLHNRGPAIPIRAIAFYAAIVLPLLYLPLLAKGLHLEEAPLLVTLLCANLAALFVGHGYAKE